MKDFIRKLNHYFRNLILDDVDKEPDTLPKYHKNFRGKRDPVKRIQERHNELQDFNKTY